MTKIQSTTVRNVTVALLTKTTARGFITAKMADLASDHAKGGNIMTVTGEIVTMRLTVDLGNQNQVIKSFFYYYYPLLKTYYSMPALQLSLIIYNIYILQIGITILGFRDAEWFSIPEILGLLYAESQNFQDC